MGLDITYYNNIKKIDIEIDEDDDNYQDKLEQLYNNNFFMAYKGYFPYQFGDLEDNVFYENDYNEGFYAGSYGGYNVWRNLLSILAGYKNSEYVWKNFNNLIRKNKLNVINGENISFPPFYELINFSDAEGIICSDICKKLYKDFVDFDEKAQEKIHDEKFGEYFYEKYKEWTQAFKIASDNGAVSFH